MTDPNPAPVPEPDPASTNPDTSTGRASSGTDEGWGETTPKKSLWREYAEAMLIAVILALTIRAFVVQAFKIPSGSMIPSLLIGDHILVNKLAYGLQLPGECEWTISFPPVTCYASNPLIAFDAPERGDVIVFRYPEDEQKDFIKRIIGVPGDTIRIENKVVYVNGTPLHDAAFTQRVDPGVIDGRINPRDNFGPLTVPDDSYFVMGDNRDQSLDSRFWGYVQRHKIKGRAFLIYWSWNGRGPWTEWVRWNRIGKGIE